MRCIVVLMSQSSSSATTENLSVTLTSNREPMLAGFPWVSAIILYTLSWGWSLLRPNTLYWDDWAYFESEFLELSADRREMGGSPLWTPVEALIRLFGDWPMQVATFALFFFAGIFAFGILRSVLSSRSQFLGSLTLIFLLAPVNHARISRICFSYSLSYFLFFLGWLLLINHHSLTKFLLSWTALLVSLSTHSLLFFVLLPFLHFVWLNKDEIKISKKLRVVHVQVFLIASLPINYLLLRKLFWPPTKDWTDYHQVTSAGLRVALLPIVIGLVPLGVIAMRKAKNLSVNFGLTLLVVGFLVTALALFPYFAGDLYVGYAGRPAYITVFEFRADWRSRHQLLMPLGLALSVVGLNELFNWRKKNFVFVATVALSVTLNMFWGSQYFLMSHKQEQLVELFATTKNKIEIASVEDQAMQFNGRGASFRSYEWNGFMTLAEISTGRPGCEALPSGMALVLKSNTPYLKALVTRDLDLYFEVKPCSEVLAENG
jgi:hypothetical protein